MCLKNQTPSTRTQTTREHQPVTTFSPTSTLQNKIQVVPQEPHHIKSEVNRKNHKQEQETTKYEEHQPLPVSLPDFDFLKHNTSVHIKNQTNISKQ